MSKGHTPFLWSFQYFSEKRMFQSFLRSVGVGSVCVCVNALLLVSKKELDVRLSLNHFVFRPSPPLCWCTKPRAFPIQFLHPPLSDTDLGTASGSRQLYINVNESSFHFQMVSLSDIPWSNDLLLISISVLVPQVTTSCADFKKLLKSFIRFCQYTSVYLFSLYFQSFDYFFTFTVILVSLRRKIC